MDETQRPISFDTKNKEAEELLKDLRHPHIFVLGCIMDRQIAAPRAWIIPYKIGVEAGGFQFKYFERLSENCIAKIFNEKKLHRFNSVQTKNFYSGICRIKEKYDGDASRIWAGNPRSATVVRRFLEFPGVGVKIATMAANILVRKFKVPMKDYSSIDISPDVRVKRFFKKHGLLREEASNEELIYLARELSPEFPGLLDLPAWQLGAPGAGRKNV